MKIIIYFLLICNIGFAAWHFRGINVSEETTISGLNISHENHLILLSEFKDKERKLSGGKLCYSLGPFNSKPSANKSEKQLKDNNFLVKRIQLRDTSRKGFWVLLPSSESRKEAKKKIQKLKKLKVTDYFLVATGTHKNGISLGVFSQKKLARRRVDEIIRLGFIPRLESVALPRKVYWLNWYKDLKEQPAYSLLSDIKRKHPQISKIERSCK